MADHNTLGTVDFTSELEHFAQIRSLVFLFFHRCYHAGWLALITGYARLLLRNANLGEIFHGRSIIFEELIPYHAMLLLKDGQGEANVPEGVLDRLVIAATYRIWTEGKTQMRRGFARMDLCVLEYLFGSNVITLFDMMSSVEFRDTALSYWYMGSSLFSTARAHAGVVLRPDKFALPPLRVTEWKCHIADLGDFRRMVIRHGFSHNDLQRVHLITPVGVPSPLLVRRLGAWPWQKCVRCQRILVCGPVRAKIAEARDTRRLIAQCRHFVGSVGTRPTGLSSARGPCVTTTRRLSSQGPV